MLRGSQTKALAAVAILALGLVIVFWDGLAYMLQLWNSLEEYNHGFLIPVVAFYLLWLRAKQVGAAQFSGSWLGVLAVAAGLFGYALGELSGLYIIIQYAFLLAVYGAVLAGIGWRGLALTWVPLAYLIFMIPLPNFLLFNLSQELQLISSAIGVAVIRAFGISVFLEGNVIDLGVYQLQVADACSGLNYLFPLMSFGFLCAALFRAPWWQRAAIFLSSIPLTVFMNSFRIGVIGILVNYFGIEQAEGFLHYFEGWIVFMVCVGLMFAMMWVFARMSGTESMMSRFGLDVPPVEDLLGVLPRGLSPQFVVTIVLVGLGIVMSFSLQGRQDLIPQRASLSGFPILVDEWRGRDQYVEEIFTDVLKTTDTLLMEFTRDEDPRAVQMWIAYYESQKKGQSAHSPRTCLPGGGWVIEEFDQLLVEDVGPLANSAMPVNRVVVVNQGARQLIYYWFFERGRVVTNEYLVKWYIFWDSLTKGRTDGSLVRLTTFVPEKSELPDADARLQAFMRDIDAQLAYFLPQEDAAFKEKQAAASLQ